MGSRHPGTNSQTATTSHNKENKLNNQIQDNNKP